MGLVSSMVQARSEAEAVAAEPQRRAPRRGPRTVTGPLPVERSVTGRAYYLFLERHGVGPVVVCGADLAVELLGGSWRARGQAPEGFATIEDALNAAAATGLSEVRVRWL